MKRPFVKSRKKWIFGVAGGLAEYLGVPPMLVRVVFVLAAAASTLGLVAYVILFVWMPKPPTEGE